MADHKMFERVKKIIALQAPTRNISTPAVSFGRSVRDASRNYASVGVIALFVAGVASPAVMAGAEDEAAREASAQSEAVVAQQQAPAEPGEGIGSVPEGSDKPAGGGAPAPRSDDPAAHEQPLAVEENGEQAPPPEAEPAAAGGGAQPAAAEPVDGIDGWIHSAIDVMEANGDNVSAADAASIRTIIDKESSGDPQAINLWDINAQRGTPSKGLMQTIDSTFHAYKLPGHEEIYDPVSNIIAGVRYTLSRYGSFAEHPGLASMAGGGGYRGY